MPAPPEESEPAMVRAIAVMALSYRRARKWRCADSADGGKPGKRFEDPGRDQRHGVGEEQDAGEHEEAAKHLLDRAEMRRKRCMARRNGLMATAAG